MFDAKTDKYKKSIAKGKKTSKCSTCHKVGHWEQECRAKKKQFKSKANNIISTYYTDVWIADSGATEHMTSCKK